MMPAGISAGRRMPAEWENQSGVLIIWPHPLSDWAETLHQIEGLYLEIATHIARYQTLICVCYNREQLDSIKSRLIASAVPLEQLVFTLAPCNDTWARDTMPINIRNRDVTQLIKFRFNGWGGKYQHDLDDRLSQNLEENHLFGETEFSISKLVLEGGALETDGQGTLLATKSSIVNSNRNPKISLDEIEQELARQLGFTRFLWLDHGCLTGDDTDGHIDTLVRFVNTDTLVFTTPEEDDEEAQGLQRMRDQLGTFTNYQGKTYKLIPLPNAGKHYDEDGRKLPASYANFLITNRQVLVPTYGVSNDQKAIDTLSGCFPDRDVTGINCEAAIRQKGAIHCLTMQFHQDIRFSRTH